jgi:hypothetical protein
VFLIVLFTLFVDNIGQGSRYLVLAPAGRGRGRGSTKAPAPIAPQPLNLPSIKSESNGAYQIYPRLSLHKFRSWQLYYYGD